MTNTRLNLLPALLAVVLGIAVAVAANGRTWSTHAGQSGWSTRTFALIVIGGAGLTALLTAHAVWRHRSAGLTWPLALTTVGPITLLTLALTFAWLLWHRISTPRCTPNCDMAVQGLLRPGAGRGGPGNGVAVHAKAITLKSGHGHPASLIWLWLALAGLVIGTVLWVWRTRPFGTTPVIFRRSRGLRRQVASTADASDVTLPDVDSAETTARYIEASLDDLRREPDLRRAIIACYARMEQLFAHLGSPRQRWETPTEFLHRSEPSNAQPLDRLTALYEEAQFSPHQLDEQRRGEAIAALTTLRDQLRPAPA